MLFPTINVFTIIIIIIIITVVKEQNIFGTSHRANLKYSLYEYFLNKLYNKRSVLATSF